YGGFDRITQRRSRFPELFKFSAQDYNMKNNLIFFWLAASLLAGCRGTGVVINQHSTDLNKIKRIAVIPVGGIQAVGGNDYDRSNVVASDIAEMAFISLGYTVIDRANLESILKEQSLSGNGLIDPEEALKIGQQFGVDTLAFVNTSADMTTMKVRLVDTEKCRVIFTYTQPPVVSMARRMHNDLKKTLTAAGVHLDKSKDIIYTDNSACYSYVNDPALIKSFQKVAIAPDSKSDLGLSALLATGFDVIERSELGKILKQNGLARSGILSGEDMKQLGAVSGVKGIIFPRMTDYLFSESKLCGVVIGIRSTIKLVDAQTGQVIWVLSSGEDAHYCSTGNITPEEYIASADKKLTKYLKKIIQ
ncbi:MAG: hypothetical protein WCK76_04790, partial [Elusimicrobiota bacterium]